MVALHGRRHLDGALLDHGEQFGRLAVTAERLQRHFNAPAGFLLDRLCKRHQNLIVSRGVFGVDRAEAQNHFRGGRRRGEKGDETKQGCGRGWHPGAGEHSVSFITVSCRVSARSTCLFAWGGSLTASTLALAD